MSNESCGSCQFYRASNVTAPGVQALAAVDLRGSCRRYPGTLAKLPTEWCGEYISSAAFLEIDNHGDDSERDANLG